MTDAEKLEIAIKALTEIADTTNWTAYDKANLAEKALKEIKS